MIFRLLNTTGKTGVIYYRILLANYRIIRHKIKDYHHDGPGYCDQVIFLPYCSPDEACNFFRNELFLINLNLLFRGKAEFVIYNKVLQLK